MTWFNGETKWKNVMPLDENDRIRNIFLGHLYIPRWCNIANVEHTDSIFGLGGTKSTKISPSTSIILLVLRDHHFQRTAWCLRVLVRSGGNETRFFWDTTWSLVVRVILRPGGPVLPSCSMLFDLINEQVERKAELSTKLYTTAQL